MIACISSLTLVFTFIIVAGSANPFVEKMSSATANMAYMNRLMRGAYPTENSQLRRLEENKNEVDISGYSIKFQKCQFVKAYDQELAEDEDASTVLATKHFVIFRLCPSDSCDKCQEEFGEYLVDMEDYLEYTIEYANEQQKEKCNQCNDECEEYYGDDNQAGEEEGDNNGGEDGNRRRLGSCNECKASCEKYENMEDYGLYEATDYVECKQIKEEGNYDNGLYAGPMCSSNGKMITIGVFSDEKCTVLESDKDVENYLFDDDNNPMELSNDLLKTTYESESCLSCLVENNDEDDDGKEPQVEDVCKELYSAAAKCERYGFSARYEDNDDASENQNQLKNEKTVCKFIKSLKFGTYSQAGDIAVGGSNSYRSGTTFTTWGQTFALIFFILGTVGLAVYAAMLHNSLTKSAKSDLSSQGGAMA